MLNWYYGQNAEDFDFTVDKWDEWLHWVKYWLEAQIDGEDEKTVECIIDGIAILGMRGDRSNE